MSPRAARATLSWRWALLLALVTVLLGGSLVWLFDHPAQAQGARASIVGAGLVEEARR